MEENQEGRRKLGPEAFVAIFDHTADGVLFTIPDGTVLAANPSACAPLGLTESQICAAGWAGIAPSGANESVGSELNSRWAVRVLQRRQQQVHRGPARCDRPR